MADMDFFLLVTLFLDLVVRFLSQLRLVGICKENWFKCRQPMF